jgi:hypothetical protein
MRPLANRILTFEEIDQLLRYEPETGHLFWRVDRGRGSNGAKAGDQAGGVANHGYVQINTRIGRVLAHRLAWLLTHRVMPEVEIDHVNGNRTDNRIKNLRTATRAQNSQNMQMHSDNQTGFKGVHKRNRRFRAEIMSGGKKTHLGYFATAQEAHRAYCEAAREYHGKFARLA